MKREEGPNVYSFKNDDSGYIEFLITNGGYVYNDFGGGNVTYKKLHKYNCPRLHNLGGGRLRTSINKVCSSNINDLFNWLNTKRGVLGKGYSECSCMNDVSYKTVDLNSIISIPKENHTTWKSVKILNSSNIKICNKDIDKDKLSSFSGKLIDIYNNKKIPKYLEEYKKAGFTKELLLTDSNKIFQLIILASYDQQPFTRAARGWEPIWFEMPGIFDKLGIFTLKDVGEISVVDIEDKLKNTTFYNYHLNNKGSNGTSYTHTFKNAFSVCEEKNILKEILNASNSREVKNIQAIISGNIKNIGPMIASKIIMYTMREIKIGKAKPGDFELITEDLLGEYHNSKLTKEVEAIYGIGFVSEVIKKLRELGDPLAIDALYYIDRDEPQLKKELLNG